MVSSDNDWDTLTRSRVLRNEKCISYHIFSSSWSSMKNEFVIAKDISLWRIGDGTRVSFWNDLWCEVPILQFLNLNQNWSRFLTARVSDFIVEG